MLFIDDDMGFDVEELVKMFEWRDSADVIAAMYPKKKFDWARVKRIVLANPDIDAAHLPNLAGDYESMWVLADNGTTLTIAEKPIPVATIGTGLMLISRRCLLHLIDIANLAVSEREALIAGGGFGSFSGRRSWTAEQWVKTTISATWCAATAQVLGCPWMTISHTGKHSFVGDLKGVARYMGD